MRRPLPSRQHARLATALGIAAAACALAPTGASAAWVNAQVRGAGTVTTQSNLDADVTMTCTGTAASTAAAPAACRYAYPLQAGPNGTWIPQQVTARATPAAGWSFSGYSAPASSQPTITFPVEETMDLIVNFTNPAPAVSIDALAASATVGASVPITVRATDDKKIASATVEVKNAAGSVVFSATRPTVPLTASWSTAGAAAGTYAIVARATDDGATSSTASSRSITLTNAGAGGGSGTSGATTGGSSAGGSTIGGVVSAETDTTAGTTSAPQTDGTPGLAGFRYVWASRTIRGRTTFTKLTIREVTAGAKLTVSCRGGGCPKRSGLRRQGKRGQWVPRGVVARKLRSGATVELRVTKVGHVGRVVRLTTHAGKPPSTVNLCLPPGAKAPTACT